MDSDAIDAIIAALEKAGHQFGAPALEHAAQAVQISGAVGIAGGIAFGAGAFMLARFSIRLLTKAHKIETERGEDWRNDIEMPLYAGGVVAGIMAGFAGIASASALLGSGWVKLLSPLGYIVAKAIGA